MEVGSEIVVVVVVAAAGLGAALAAGWHRWRDRRARRARARRAARGARAADRVLEGAGWRVVEVEAGTRFPVEVDGTRAEIRLRFDRVVARGGRTRVAEVKTGAAGPDPLHEPTRRQLLEYALASGTDRVLLVDVERGTVHEVRFPRLTRRPGRWPVWAAGLAGVGFGWAAATAFDLARLLSGP